MEHREEHPRAFQLCFGKRPAEELYRVADDPGQLNSLAADPAHAEVKQQLGQELERHLLTTNAPRAEGRSPWDDYPFLAGGHDPRAKKKSP